MVSACTAISRFLFGYDIAHASRPRVGDGTHGPDMRKDMFVSQLKRLEGWFVRLPIDAETARILAYLDLDEGVNLPR